MEFPICVETRKSCVSVIAAVCAHTICADVRLRPGGRAPRRRALAWVLSWCWCSRPGAHAASATAPGRAGAGESQQNGARRVWRERFQRFRAWEAPSSAGALVAAWPSPEAGHRPPPPPPVLAPSHRRLVFRRRPLPEGRLELTAACNAPCACRPEHYSPVCGSNGLTYYSPCHAGCPGEAAPGADGRKVSPAAAREPRAPRSGRAPAPPSGNRRCCCAPQVYRDCSCIPQNFSSGFGHATAGKCTSTCQRKSLLLVFVFVVIIFTFLSSIPALTATLR